MTQRRMPIGIDDFAKLRNNNFYYADKTGMIKELIDNWGEVNLFTRPRRFGKSINMSMLQHFFEIGTDPNLFRGLFISKDREFCEKYMGHFPVISISLKTVEGKDFRTARANLCTVIGNEAERFHFLLEGDMLSENDRKKYQQLVHIGEAGEDIYGMSDAVLMGSLKTLSDILFRYYNRQVIILIDEYDVPLQKAKAGGYYVEMIEVMRSIFNAGLKSNDSLFFAVMTGCLRIAKESIFTGLNNLKIYSILDDECDEYFGFTEEEVQEMFSEYDLQDYYEVTKEWYDGYRIGGSDVYNPWDVINYCNQLRNSRDRNPRSYWANSSGNEELRQFIGKMGDGITKAQIERLIAGQSVQKVMEEQVTYDTMYDNVENMWSLLFATGYLTQSTPSEGNVVRLKIPNEEVRSIFSEQILKMFEKKAREDGKAVEQFCHALKSGDSEAVERIFTQFMSKTISIRDTAVRKKFKESFYHGMLLGILNYKSDWSVESNREAGDGYYDIMIEIEDESIGIIIEVKYAEKGQHNKACQEALRQIDKNDYTADLREDGMQTIRKYGISCYKKECCVLLA